MKVGDIVRMKPGVTWIKEVRKYIGHPLTVYSVNKVLEQVTLRLLNESRPLLTPDTHKPWTWNIAALEIDEFCTAVQKSRTVEDPHTNHRRKGVIK